MIHVVGIGEIRISADPEDMLVTYTLGSCLGITIYDPVARVGGLMHAMLPLSKLSPGRACEEPGRFIDTGVPHLFKESYKLGARKDRIILTAAGGSSAGGDDASDLFQIGQRNILTLRKLLWKNGVLMKSEALGGRDARTVTLFVSDGNVSIISNGERNVVTEALNRQAAAANGMGGRG